MKALQVRLPEAIHEIVRQETLDFFRAAAAAFDPDAFAEALDAVPDAPPNEGDRLP